MLRIHTIVMSVLGLGLVAATLCAGQGPGFTQVRWIFSGLTRASGSFAGGSTPLGNGTVDAVLDVDGSGSWNGDVTFDFPPVGGGSGAFLPLTPSGTWIRNTFTGRLALAMDAESRAQLADTVEMAMGPVLEAQLDVLELELGVVHNRLDIVGGDEPLLIFEGELAGIVSFLVPTRAGGVPAFVRAPVSVTMHAVGTGAPATP